MRNKWNGFYVGLAVMLISLGAAAHAQFLRVESGPVTQEFNYKVAGDGQNTFFFESNMESPLVKGSPYTAKAITTTTQMLADGNKITHTNEVQLARDSEGRTRREQSLAELGPWKTNNSGSIVSINDPVAHVRYELRREGDKTMGTKMQSLERTRVLEQKARAEAEASQIHEGHGSSVGVGVGVGDEPGMGRNIVIVTSGNENPAIRYKTEQDANQNKNTKVEELGTQTIEGVSANGTRKTVTIPAGQVGNEQPINVVSETWYSPDLQLTVMSKRNDPRVGETEFKLTNIQRVEPDPSLFQAPPGVDIVTPKMREREF
jgi:hypothetical protein